MKDPALQGTHKGCGGQVCDAGCEACGADFIHVSRIISKPSKPASKPGKPVKKGKK